MTPLASDRRALHAQPSAFGDRAGAPEGTAMPDERDRLTPDELRVALASLGLSQSEFARLLVVLGDTAGDKERTVQRWATGQQDVPGPITAVLVLLAVLQDSGVSGAALRALDAGSGLPRPWEDAPDGGEAVIVEDRRKR